VGKLKYVVLLCGVAGLVGCFLPQLSSEGVTLSFWEMRPFYGLWSIVAFVLGGYGLAAAMGLVATISPPLLRWQALVAFIGFAIVLYKLHNEAMDMVKTQSYGARIMIGAAVVGLLASAAGVIFRSPD
jgi:hypothetical protein